MFEKIRFSNAIIQDKKVVYRNKWSKLIKTSFTHLGRDKAIKEFGMKSKWRILPKQFGNYKGRKIILGICLGFQQILYCEGAKIIQQKQIYHGFQSEIKVISRNSIFQHNDKYKVGRYHSLKLKEPFYSQNFDITMRCAISGSAMALENNTDKIYGFQFHPESFLTENGNLLIKKILSA